MNRQKSRKTENRSLEACRVLLEAHYAGHRTIPSMAGLARLWGYASKSSAARRVDELIEAGILLWSPDRRLAPGPSFRMVLSEDEIEIPAGSLGGISALETAQSAWRDEYGHRLARSYSMTARLLRLARSMEQHMARSAAKEGLTSGDVLLLDVLHRVGPPHRIAPTALKHYFLMSLAGVSKRVDRLEALGFIERIPNPEDRRGLFIQLTTSGRDALSRLAAADQNAAQIVWPLALSETQYQTMIDSLDIAENLIAHEAD